MAVHVLVCVVNDNPRRNKPEQTNAETTSAGNHNGDAAAPNDWEPRFEHREALQWSLWRIIVEHTNHRGDAKISDVLGAAEERNISRFWAADMLMAWIERGDIKRSTAPNCIVPQRKRWKP